MKRKSLFVVLALALCLVLLLSGCGGGGEPETPAVTEAPAGEVSRRDRKRMDRNRRMLCQLANERYRRIISRSVLASDSFFAASYSTSVAKTYMK